MDENEIAEQFAEIVKNDTIINNPIYQQLVLELNVACAKMFDFLKAAGEEDVSGVMTHMQCFKGHIHPLFRITKLDQDEGYNDD